MVFDMYTWFHGCCRFSSMCQIGGNVFTRNWLTQKNADGRVQISNIILPWYVINHEIKTGLDRCLASKIDRIWSRILFFPNWCANFAPLSHELQAHNCPRYTGAQKWFLDISRLWMKWNFHVKCNSNVQRSKFIETMDTYTAQEK